MKKLAIVSLLASICWAYPINTLAQTADQPKPNTQTEISYDYQSDDIIVKDNAIQPKTSVIPSPEGGIRPIDAPRQVSGRHSTRAESTISASALQNYLEGKASPLANYSALILQSPYWSTIIGICTIEQYGCSRAPGNNYWGIGPGKQFASIPDGISAIDSLLAKYESRGYNTIEKLNGYYVQPASQNWLNTVLKTKLTLESLNEIQ